MIANSTMSYKNIATQDVLFAVFAVLISTGDGLYYKRARYRR